MFGPRGVRRACLVGSALVAPHASATALEFASFVLDVGAGESPMVLHGDLLGDGEADEIVVFDRQGGERRLALYQLADLAESWRLVRSIKVDSNVIFADTIELAGSDRLLLYRRGSVDWLDFDDWRAKALVAAPSLYNVPNEAVPHVNIGRDVNDDGREDIAVPGFDGYRLWLQMPGGGLAGPTELPIAATARTTFGMASYRPRSLYALDYDGDGVGDLAVWDDEGEGRLLVHRGKADGRFHSPPIATASPVAFDSDDVTVSFGWGDGNPTTLFYDLEDYDGDGVGDIAATTTDADGLFDQSTRYDFYFGRRDGGVTTFPAEPNTSIVSDTLQSPFDAMDMNGDGRTDFGMGSVDIGVGMLIRLLLTGTLRFDLDFYVLRDSGYAERPDVTRPVKIRFSLKSGDVLSGNWVELGDATGDGVVDLLARYDDTRIDVYPGTATETLFAERPLPIAVDLPDRRVGPGDVEVADLNHDERDDLLIRYPKRPEEKSNRIGIVLSR